MRRHTLRLSWILTCCFVSIAGADHTVAADLRTNIVFVLFDDLGYGQPKPYQAQTTFKMPHFERFVTQGMRFTDAHSASAVCTPTRYGLLTGRYPARINQYGVLTTYSKPLIPESQVTVASFLKQQGYATACIGKWHLGWNWVDGMPGSQRQVPIGAKLTDGPNAVGFDEFYGFTHARNIGSIVLQDTVVANVQESQNQPLMIEHAVEWLNGRKGMEQPFFLYFPMCPPHTPIAPSAEFVGKSGAEDTVKKDPRYGDWILQGDAMLGEILAALDRNGLSENTLVIVTSDNGAEQRAYAPLRDSKRSIYEGGHRVPFVARWPKRIPPGSSCEATICLNDLLATAAEVIGTPLPAGAGEDSFSLLPLLLGKGSEFTRPHTIHQSMAGDLAIRQNEWKLIAFRDGGRALYNIQDDLSETIDVIGKHPEVANRLEQALTSTLGSLPRTVKMGNQKANPRQESP